MNITLLENIVKLLLIMIGGFGFSVLLVIWAIMNPAAERDYDANVVQLTEEEREYLLSISTN